MVRAGAVLAMLVGCGFTGGGSAAPDAALDAMTDAMTDASRPPEDTTAPPDTVLPPGDAAFDVARCPSEYTGMLVGITRSRYRAIINGERAWTQAGDCADDLAGATHLVTIDDAAELALVQGFLNAYPMGFAADKAWIGAVQARDQAVDDGWLGPDGEPLIDAWLQPNEPNDGGAIDVNTEQFASLSKNNVGLIDYRGDQIHGAICECDGVAQASAFTALVTANSF